MEDEIFYGLEGEIALSFADRTIKGTPGTMIFLTRDVRHSFTIESEQSGCLFLLHPPGLKRGSGNSVYRRPQCRAAGK
jgi:ethanolamine utilization protein EutQ (cupin superfamily)